MRNYQVLDKAIVEKDNVLRLTPSEDHPEQPKLAMSREGAFVSISASFGPLELALRLQYSELVRRLKNLYPVPGLATTRQVGTGNAYIALGLTKDNRLVLRPAIVADASGHITFNLLASQEVYLAILKWLDVDPEE